jgi:hypothetical protein
MSVEETLKERGTRYGDFCRHAQISQDLKDVVDRFASDTLHSIHREAIDMILHKLARILNGDPNYADSWHDIAGYATLVEQWIQKLELPPVVFKPGEIVRVPRL